MRTRTHAELPAPPLQLEVCLRIPACTAILRFHPIILDPHGDAPRERGYLKEPDFSLLRHYACNSWGGQRAPSFFDSGERYGI